MENTNQKTNGTQKAILVVLIAILLIIGAYVGYKAHRKAQLKKAVREFYYENKETLDELRNFKW